MAFVCFCDILCDVLQGLLLEQPTATRWESTMAEKEEPAIRRWKIKTMLSSHERHFFQVTGFDDYGNKFEFENGVSHLAHNGGHPGKGWSFQRRMWKMKHPGYHWFSKAFQKKMSKSQSMKDVKRSLDLDSLVNLKTRQMYIPLNKVTLKLFLCLPFVYSHCTGVYL